MGDWEDLGGRRRIARKRGFRRLLTPVHCITGWAGLSASKMPDEGFDNGFLERKMKVRSRDGVRPRIHMGNVGED